MYFYNKGKNQVIVPKNRSTIFASEKHLEKQAKGLDFAQRRHLDTIRENSSVNFYFDKANGRSIMMTVNPHAHRDRNLNSAPNANQRLTIFSNQILLEHNTRFVNTQSKKHFLNDFKSQGLGMRATFDQQQTPAYLDNKFSKKISSSPLKNMTSSNNPLVQPTSISVDPRGIHHNIFKDSIRARGVCHLDMNAGTGKTFDNEAFSNVNPGNNIYRKTYFDPNIMRGNGLMRSSASHQKLDGCVSLTKIYSQTNLSSANKTNRRTYNNFSQTALETDCLAKTADRVIGSGTRRLKSSIAEKTESFSKKIGSASSRNLIK